MRGRRITKIVKEIKFEEGWGKLEFVRQLVRQLVYPMFRNNNRALFHL